MKPQQEAMLRCHATTQNSTLHTSAPTASSALTPCRSRARLIDHAAVRSLSDRRQRGTHTPAVSARDRARMARTHAAERPPGSRRRARAADGCQRPRNLPGCPLERYPFLARSDVSQPRAADPAHSSKPGSAGSRTRLLLPTKLPRADARAPVSRCSKSPLVPRAGCRSGSGDQTLQADFDRLWPPRCHHVHSTPAFFHSPPVGSTALGAPIYPCHHLTAPITRSSTASKPAR